MLAHRLSLDPTTVRFKSANLNQNCGPKIEPEPCCQFPGSKPYWTIVGPVPFSHFKNCSRGFQFKKLRVPVQEPAVPVLEPFKFFFLQPVGPACCCPVWADSETETDLPGLVLVPNTEELGTARSGSGIRPTYHAISNRSLIAKKK